MRLAIKITSDNKTLLDKHVYMTGGDSLEVTDEADTKILIEVKETLWSALIARIQQLFRGKRWKC